MFVLFCFVLCCLISISFKKHLSNKRRNNVMTMFVAFIYESNDVFGFLKKRFFLHFSFYLRDFGVCNFLFL